LALFVLLAGCGDDGDGTATAGDGDGDGDGDNPIAGLVSIAVEPADAVFDVTDGTPATADYTAVGTFDDGRTEDITDQVSFRLANTALGGFLGATLTSVADRGGRTSVIAVPAGGNSPQGLTGVTLRLNRTQSDPDSTDLPADPDGPFEGPEDSGRAPELVYPNDGTLVPPNLRELEVHFVPGNGNDLFEISFSNDTTDVRVFARCTEPVNGGCVYLPDAEVWSWIAESNRGQSPLAIRVRGTDDQGTGVGASASVDVSFSFDDIAGGLYYWTTDAGTAIMRYDFAGDQDGPEKFAGPENTDGTCVGCHALSRDGTKLVAEAGGQNDGRLLLMDVASQTALVPFASGGRSIFESWNPDGSQFVGVFADGNEEFNLILFDGNTAAELGTIDVGAQSRTDAANHPDWSPDGSQIVYTRGGAGGTNQKQKFGAIEMVTDQGGGVWSAPETLVARVAGEHNYYPSFSPDGDVVVFNRSTCDGGDNNSASCDSDMDPSAQLFIMRAEAGATPVEMTLANAPGVRDGGTALTNSFPKWSPFVFRRTDEVGSRLMWLTFTSRRQFGLRNVPDGGLIWMVGLDPDRIALGLDPSFASFVLPFQDVTTSNHIAQWTERVVPPVE